MKNIKGICLTFYMCLMAVFYAHAQDDYWEHQSAVNERNRNMDRLFTYIERLNLGIDPGYRRVSIMNVSFSKNEMTERTADLIKTEVENALFKNGFIVVKIAEFEAPPHTHVQVNDSLVRISRIKPINQIKSNSDSLIAMARKYGVQCFVDCNLAYDDAKGYMLGIQFFNCFTRELIASTTLMSNPGGAEWSFSDYILSGGLGFFPKAKIVESADTLSGDKVTSSYFSADFAWRQPINDKKTSFFGFNVGMYIVQTNTASTVHTYFLAHGCAKYYLAFFERDKRKGSHYLEWAQGLGVYAARNFNLYAEEGININITENMGLSGTFNYLFKDMYFNSGSVNAGNIGYQISAYYKF